MTSNKLYSYYNSLQKKKKNSPFFYAIFYEAERKYFFMSLLFITPSPTHTLRNLIIISEKLLRNCLKTGKIERDLY